MNSSGPQKLPSAKSAKKTPKATGRTLAERANAVATPLQAANHQANDGTGSMTHGATFRPPSARPEVFVKQDGSLVRILTADICYIEALGDYVNIYTVGAGRFTLYATMKEMEAKLPPFDFARAHRKFIARLDRITSIDNDVLRMDVGGSGHPSEIPIGNSYKSTLLGCLNVL